MKEKFQRAVEKESQAKAMFERRVGPAGVPMGQTYVTPRRHAMERVKHGEDTDIYG